MTKVPVRIGLIGVGKMGQNHLRVLSMLNSVSLVFVYDLNLDAARRAAAPFQTPVAENLERALEEVDAVVICSPTATHADYVRLAAGKVRQLFVEKPLADTTEAARELVRLVGGGSHLVQVGFIERFNPAVQALKTVLDRSERVVSVDLTRTNRLSARITDVDVVTDLMIHDIDLALYLNGPVTTVTAHGAREGEMIDLAAATLVHGNGRLSRILASRITEKKIRSIQATCLDMFVNCDLLRKEIFINRQSQLQQREGEPYVIGAIEETVEVRPQEALLLELQAFVAACRGDAGTRVPNAEDGLAAQAICDEIRGAIPR